MKRSAITASLIFSMLMLPFNSRSDAPPPPPKNDWFLAACVVAVAVAAAGAVVIIAKKCKPKYYCIKDNESPPTYWVGATTQKECEINGWTPMSGPYDSPDECPSCPPPHGATNVTTTASSPSRITVQSSRNLMEWAPVFEMVCDPEEFAYTVTNPPTDTVFFRLKIEAP